MGPARTLGDKNRTKFDKRHAMGPERKRFLGRDGASISRATRANWNVLSAPSDLPNRAVSGDTGIRENQLQSNQ